MDERQEHDQARDPLAGQPGHEQLPGNAEFLARQDGENSALTIDVEKALAECDLVLLARTNHESLELGNDQYTVVQCFSGGAGAVEAMGQVARLKAAGYETVMLHPLTRSIRRQLAEQLLAMPQSQIQKALVSKPVSQPVQPLLAEPQPVSETVWAFLAGAVTGWLLWVCGVRSE